MEYVVLYVFFGLLSIAALIIGVDYAKGNVKTEINNRQEFIKKHKDIFGI